MGHDAVGRQYGNTAAIGETRWLIVEAAEDDGDFRQSGCSAQHTIAENGLVVVGWPEAQPIFFALAVSTGRAI